MAEYLIQDSTLTGIADAIRAKEGTSAGIPVTSLAQRIAALPSGGDGGGGDGSLETVSATITIYGNGSVVTVIYTGANGTVTQSGIDGEVTITPVKNTPVVVAYGNSNGTYLKSQDGSGYTELYSNAAHGAGASCHVLSFSESGSIIFEEA